MARWWQRRQSSRRLQAYVEGTKTVHMPWWLTGSTCFVSSVFGSRTRIIRLRCISIYTAFDL